MKRLRFLAVPLPLLAVLVPGAPDGEGLSQHTAAKLPAFEVRASASETPPAGPRPDARRELHVTPGGNDAATGAADAPFRTIGRAAAEAGPGDTVVIHAGIYREMVTLTRGGTAEDRRITFRPAAGETAVVKGSGPVSGWQARDGGLWSADFPAPADAQLFLDGNALERRASQAEVAKTARSWCADGPHLVANFGPADPRGRLVEVSVRPAGFTAAGPEVSFVTLDGLTVGQTATPAASIDGAQPGAIWTGGGTHWIVQNCTIHDSSGTGLSLGAPALTSPAKGRSTPRSENSKPLKRPAITSCATTSSNAAARRASSACCTAPEARSRAT